MIRRLTLLLATMSLAACASKPPLEVNGDFAPIRPLEPAADALPTGSILGNSMHMSLFQGQRKWRVGDIVTVVLNESTQASRNTSLITERVATNDALSSSWTNSKQRLAQRVLVPLLKRMRFQVLLPPWLQRYYPTGISLLRAESSCHSLRVQNLSRYEVLFVRVMFSPTIRCRQCAWLRRKSHTGERAT